MSIVDFLERLDFEEFEKWRENRQQERSGTSEQSNGTGVSDADKELTESLNHLNVGNPSNATSSTPPSPTASGANTLDCLPAGDTQMHGAARRRDDKEYFELIKEFAISDARAANIAASIAETSYEPGKERSFKDVLDSFLTDTAEHNTLREQGKMRRCLLYNPGHIQIIGANQKWIDPYIQKDVIELMNKINLDVVLLNELCLKYSADDDGTKNKLHEDLKKKFLELTKGTYLLKSIVPSFKTVNESSYPWKCGSAILVRNKIERNFDTVQVEHEYKDGSVKNFDGHFGGFFDFESAIARDNQLDVPIICAYIHGQRSHRYHKKAAEQLLKIDGGVGGGDLNMKDGNFEEYFSSIDKYPEHSKMKDCGNDTYFTHQDVKKGEYTYSRIDYIFIDERVKHLSVIVHKPLLADKGVGETHYPIIFDIIRVEDGTVPTTTWCTDSKCQFKCTEREGGLDDALIQRRNIEAERERSIQRGENVPKKRGRRPKNK